MRRALRWEGVGRGDRPVTENVGERGERRVEGGVGDADWVRKDKAGDAFAPLRIELDGLASHRVVSYAFVEGRDK